MYNTWHTLKLKEICEITSSKRIYLSDYQTEGIPFYRGKEIIERQKGYSEVTTKLFISMEKFDEIRSKFGVPKVGDLLLTSVGTLGVPYIVKQNDEFYFKDGNLTWFRNLRGIDSKYLYYWILSPLGRAQLKKCTIGSSQPAMTIILLKEMNITLPLLPTQRKIAAILSAYDDLIENNLRRIKILEELAQNLYTEWFVKFRFPGHEKVKLVDSSLGRIPEGWKTSNLDDLVNHIHESTVPGDHLSDRLYVPIDCIPKHSLAILESEPWDNARSSLQLFDEMDILFGAMRPYFHKVAIAPFKGITRTTCFVLRPRDSEVFSYSVMTLFQEETIEFANIHSQGSTIPYVAWEGALANMPCLEPPDHLLKTFNSAVYPILGLIHLQYFIQKNLRLTRDLLLPRLISGELDVSGLDIKTGDDE